MGKFLFGKSRVIRVSLKVIAFFSGSDGEKKKVSAPLLKWFLGTSLYHSVLQKFWYLASFEKLFLPFSKDFLLCELIWYSLWT